MSHDLGLGRELRFWLIGFAVFFAALYLLSGILLPFVAGMAIAYLLDPICDWLEGRGLSRTLATTALTLVFLVLVAGGLLLLVPLVAGQLAGFAARAPAYIEALRGQVEQLQQLIEARMEPDQMARIEAALAGSAQKLVGWSTALLGRLISGGAALANLLSLLVITPVVAFYLLRDWDHLVERVDAWLPRHQAETIREQMREVDRMLAGFVRGQSSVCLLLGVFYAAGLTLAGLDFGLLIGLAAGLLTFIPYVGSAVGLVASVGMALVQFDDWTRVAVVAAIFLVGQVLEGNAPGLGHLRAACRRPAVRPGRRAPRPAGRGGGRRADPLHARPLSRQRLLLGRRAAARAGRAGRAGRGGVRRGRRELRTWRN
jgi:predicted PurR-regulated permease PerM